MGQKAKQRRIPRSEPKAPKLIGKTITNAVWVGGSEQEGYSDLRLTFTDGTEQLIGYSCMGGVYLGDD